MRFMLKFKGIPVFADDFVGVASARRFRCAQPPVIVFAKATRPSDESCSLLL